MTSEHGHKNDTTNGQRVSRHSLPTLLCFNFFPTAQKKIEFLLPPHKWHIWFFPTHEPTLKKPKEPFFSQRTDRKTDNKK